MTKYNSLNVKLSNSQLNKLKSDDEINIPHKFLLADRQVENLCKATANKSSTDINLPKNQLLKMIQSGGFLGRLLGPLLETGLSLIKCN